MLNKKWWLIGFLDAEGNFQIFPKKRLREDGSIKYYNVGYGFHLSLSIKDREIIIRSKLNSIGKIYSYNNRGEVRLAVTKIKGKKNWNG